jgi:hypothetical protein
MLAAMMRRRFYMNWQQRGAAWLALFGVLVQLVASFGHVHPEDYRFFLHGDHALVLTAGNGPTGNFPALPGDIDCPICASVLLLGSSALPNAVVLPLPQVAETASSFVGDALWLTPPRHLLFTTRGPPLV